MQQGETIKWADVQNLYNKLNVSRNKWSLSSVAVPTNPGMVTNQPVSNLKTLIDSMSSISYLNSVANSSNISLPSKGTLIQTIPFDLINQKIDDIQNTCQHNSANYSADWGDYSFNYPDHTDNPVDYTHNPHDGGYRSYNDHNAIYNETRYNSDTDDGSYRGASYSFG